MASEEVIKDAGNTLRFILDKGINSTLSPVTVILATPDEFEGLKDTPTPTVTIFLYQVAVNPDLRNGPMRMRADGSRARRALPLELCFMITPWVNGTDGTEDEFRIVGRILRTLYDQSELSREQLQGDSWAPEDTVQIIFEALSMDDHYRIWDSFGLPYRLSLNYILRVIGIDPSRSVRTAPVVEARFKEGPPP